MTNLEKMNYTCNRCKASLSEIEIKKDEDLKPQYNEKIKKFQTIILEHNKNRKFYQSEWFLQLTEEGLVGIVEKSFNKVFSEFCIGR